MSNDTNLPDLSGPLPLDLAMVEIAPAQIIPTTEFICPCERIEPETKEFAGSQPLPIGSLR